MTEVVRRADILQKRAIRQRLEREERAGKAPTEAAAAAGEGADGDGTPAPEEDPAGAGSAARTPPSAHAQRLQQKRHRAETQHQQRLWVDKHAPTNISHLLSDEHTNREVLRALRAWDPYVFKRAAPARPAPAYPNQWQPGEGNAWQKDKAKDGREGAAVQDGRADPRPAENARVLLLSGPPGVGKTTLANIICRHAGYRPIEVNASDERTASALMERVLRAMESSTLDFGTGDRGEGGPPKGRGGGGRPNCIILDEVDGADARAAIAALVDVVRADLPAPGARAKKSGRRATPHLRRPIILICNHKYAPALRPLLPYARQFDVRPPAPARLAGRLRAVLAQERLSVVAGGALLRRLVAATGGDVRSSLYALQFASARAREVARRKGKGKGEAGARGTPAVVDISGTLMLSLGDRGNGMKDMQGDVASTVATVFRKVKKSAADGGRQNKRQKTGGRAHSSTTSGVNLVLKAVDHFGDNSKTLDCLFTNVNRVSFIDPTLDRTAAALEWLSDADTYRSHRSTVAANNTAEFYSCQKFYIPSAAGAVHLLCRVETRPDLTFHARELVDARYRAEANASLVRRFVEGLTPRARRGAGGGVDQVVGDVIPYALWLLSAGAGPHALARPVSSVDMLGEEERAAFGAHVATLRALGLTYVREEGAATFDDEGGGPAAGESTMRLEPEIDKLVRFEDTGGGAAADHCRKDVPPLLKELLAHGATVAALRERESEAQIIAQQEDAKAAAAGASAGQKAKPTPKAAPNERKSAPATTAAPAGGGVTPTKQPPKKARANTSAAKHFLGFRAVQAKQAKTARRAARVGFEPRSSKQVKPSNTGSGVALSRVIRFKYQRGFTQAVRAPCQLEDLL